jgi:hypothetical protein
MPCTGALVVVGGWWLKNRLPLEYLNGTDWVEYPLYAGSYQDMVVLPCP